MAERRTHYEVLGVPQNATHDEIKTAYRRAARGTHPDHGGDADEFRRVSLAYETLGDPAARSSYDRNYGGLSGSSTGTTTSPPSAATPASGFTAGAHGSSGTSRATRTPTYVPAYQDGVVPPLGRELAEQRVHGTPRKRGLFSAHARLQREAQTISLISNQVLSVLPAARLVNGIHSPGDRGFVDHALLAGYRLALVDSMLLPEGIYRWDGQTLFRDGKPIRPPRLSPAVSKMQELLMPEVNVTGWTVIHSPNGNLHEPVIDYARGAEPSSSSSLTHVVNSANLVRELKMFLGTGPTPNVVNVPVLGRLLGGMY